MEQEARAILDKRIELISKMEQIRRLHKHLRDLKEDFNQMDRYYHHLLFENRRHQQKIEYYQDKLEVGLTNIKTGIRLLDPNSVKCIIREQISFYEDNSKELKRTGEKIASINKEIQHAYQQITMMYQ